MVEYKFKDLDLVNTSFLFLTPIATVISAYYWLALDSFSWSMVWIAVIFYIMTGLSITAGYHRLFSHKAYDAHPIVKIFFLVFGASAFQNSVLKWGSDHRLHHNKVDSESDPYNINEGFFYAHMGWILLKKNGEVKEKYAKDMMNDKLILWQHKYYLLIAAFAGFVLPTFIGGFFFDSYLGGLTASLARIVLLHHCTFFINSLCHCVGTTPYTDTNTAKDSWFMAFLTFGEGYHNFHHFFQTDYRNGIRWFQFDPTKWLIDVLNLTGLANKLKVTSNKKILAARMNMKLKRVKVKNKWVSNEKIQELELIKSRILDSIQNFEEYKIELKTKRDNLSESMKNDLQLKLETAKAEFRHSMNEWRIILNSFDQLSLNI
jgi:stearoyl-CoA desaturase (delta-9 desaturase)